MWLPRKLPNARRLLKKYSGGLLTRPHMRKPRGSRAISGASGQRDSTVYSLGLAVAFSRVKRTWTGSRPETVTGTFQYSSVYGSS